MNITDITPEVVLDMLKFLDNLGFQTPAGAARSFIYEKEPEKRFPEINNLNIDELAVLHRWRMNAREVLQLRG